MREKKILSLLIIIINVIGFMPLLAANALSFLFVRIKRKCVKFLFFIPSVTCFIIVVSYWITSLG